MRNLSLKLFIIASLVLFGGLYYYSGEIEDHYQENASRYLDQSLRAIANWQPEEIKMRLAPEAQANVSDAQLAKLCRHYEHLGAFVSMEEPKLSRLSAALSVFGGQPRLSYSSRVTFSNGSAVMTSTLVLKDRRFRFYNFNLGKSKTADS